MAKATPEQTILMDIRARGLPEPVFEYAFATGRKWRFDYCWPEKMVALELDGGVHTQGRHTRGSGYANDCRKLNAATVQGWRVIRVTTGMAGEAIDWLERLLA